MTSAVLDHPSGTSLEPLAERVATRPAGRYNGWGSMPEIGSKAQLYLDGTPVGLITIRGWADSWGFGDFHPNDDFSKFANVFGQWSLLMHADDDEPKMSRDAAEELRQAEYAIDALHARLFFQTQTKWVDIAQINIDGPLIEWKQT